MNLNKSALLEQEAVPEAAVILTFGLDLETHRFYESLFDAHGWRVRPVENLDHLRRYLREHPASVVLSAERDWRSVLAETRWLEQPPACIVLGETSIWNDVIAAGGFDVIPPAKKPYEAMWAVSAAWHDWMNRGGK